MNKTDAGQAQTEAQSKRHYLFQHDRDSRWVLCGRELHCGDCFQVRRDNGPWFDVRIEPLPRKGFYLVGLHPTMNNTDLDLYEGRFYP